MSEFKVYEDPEAVAQAAADYLFDQIKNCVSERGQCHVVLPGGTTPARCLELLADKPLPWKSIHWYPSDERCYPAGHAERNDSMITDKLFSHQKNIIENFHPMPAELGPEQGAAEYTILLDSIEKIDIVVLGMGEDGHTASLFPGNDALNDKRSAAAVHCAPKPPGDRISIGLDTLKAARKRIVITTGASKREALTRIREGEALPVSRVEPDFWFVDEAAAV